MRDRYVKVLAMEIEERVQRYKAIEDYRKRPLVVYATTTRGNVAGRMANDAVREFIDQNEAITKGDELDILLHSTGGDALTAWKLMSVLRERFNTVEVLVPYMAFSAATIFCLGADRIIMHPHASLGPIDPQIAIKLPDGSSRQFSFEDVGAFLRFISEEVKITEQVHLSAIVEKLFSVVDPVIIGGAKRASELSSDVGERLLKMHMKGAEELTRPRTIAEELNKSFFSHGDAVSRSRARELQLKIAENDPNLERLIWEAYLGIEDCMELREPYKPLEYFLANGGAQAVAPQAPLVLPSNASTQIINQLWQQVAQNALQALQHTAVEVEFKLVNAIVESPRIASHFLTKGGLTASRVGGGEIKLTSTIKESGWRRIAITGAQRETKETEQKNTGSDEQI